MVDVSLQCPRPLVNNKSNSFSNKRDMLISNLHLAGSRPVSARGRA